MARIASDAKLGQFPLDDFRIDQLIKIIKPNAMRSRLLDPFCHAGNAMLRLSEAWNCEPFGVEIDEELARTAQLKHPNGYARVIHADSYDGIIGSNRGFGVLYVNSPYSDDATEQETKRAEFKALKHFEKYLQPGGLMVWVAYAQHVSEKLARYLLENYAAVYGFYWDAMHLDTYRQICLIAVKPNAESNIEKAVVDIDAMIAAMIEIRMKKDKPEECVWWRSFSKGMYKNEYGSGDVIGAKFIEDEKGAREVKVRDWRIPVPAPYHIRRFSFMGKEPDPVAATQLIEKYGAHKSPEFARLTQRPFIPPPPQPVGRLRFGQLAVASAAGMLDGVRIEHNGVPAVMRGSTERQTKLISKETEEGKDGYDRTVETYHTVPNPRIVVLDQKGTMSMIKDDEKVIDFVGKHAQTLIDYFVEVFKPLYDMTIHPFWGEYFDQFPVKGKHMYIPTQEYATVATLEALLFKKYMIDAFEMAFGKALCLDSSVLTPSGWKFMGDIKFNDEVINSRGRTSKVIGVFPQGEKDIYRMTLKNGAKAECSSDHLWEVSGMPNEYSRVVPFHQVSMHSNELLIPVIDEGIVYWEGIKSIEYVGKKEAQCIAVDSDDHLYVTDDYILTHNTVIGTSVIVNMRRFEIERAKKPVQNSSVKEVEYDAEAASE